MYAHIVLVGGGFVVLTQRYQILSSGVEKGEAWFRHAATTSEGVPVYTCYMSNRNRGRYNTGA